MGRALEFEPERFVDVRDHQVVVVVRTRGVGQGSGASIEHRSGHLVTIRGGRIARLRIYADHAEAFAAAGRRA